MQEDQEEAGKLKCSFLFMQCLKSSRDQAVMRRWGKRNVTENKALSESTETVLSEASDVRTQSKSPTGDELGWSSKGNPLVHGQEEKSQSK